MNRLALASVAVGLLLVAVPTRAASRTLAGGGGSSADPTSATPGWAGYLVHTGGGFFEQVEGGWVQPKIVCNRPESSAAFWVGLGGAAADSQALEQIGTSADCSDRALPSYTAWYQLVPAPPVELSLTIRPGNAVTAEVAVVGRRVRLALHDVSTGASFSTELSMPSPETDSAEWIVEAPSACFPFTTCAQLPLADFDRVRFTDASTRVGTYKGTIADPAWSRQRLVMSIRGGSRLAVPTWLSGNGSSFVVRRLQRRPLYGRPSRNP